MRYRRLGRTGLQVSEIGFGTAPVGIPDYVEPWDPWDPASVQTVAAALHTALDLGVNYLDTAPGYGDGRAEELIGQCLASRRDHFILATKTPAPPGGWRHLTEAHVRQTAEASLRRLRTDVLDLLQFHGGIWSREEARAVLDGPGLAAYGRLREEGKVRFLGVTGEDPETLRPFIESGAFDVVMLRYNVIYQEAWHSILPLCQALDVGVAVMRPLTSGIFQKLLRAFRPDIDQYLDLHEVALQYVLSDPRVGVAVVGMRRPEEVRRNVAIAADERRRIDLDWLHERRAGPAPPRRVAPSA